MGPPPGDSWSADIVKALNRLAATQASLDAVVAKAAKEREAEREEMAAEKAAEKAAKL